MKPIDSRAFTILKLLGIEVTELEHLTRLPRKEASQLLDGLKDKAHRNWKRLALELHPDRTGDDPVRTELFKQATFALEQLRAFSLPEPVIVRGIIRDARPHQHKPRRQPLKTGAYTAKMRP